MIFCLNLFKAIIFALESDRYEQTSAQLTFGAWERNMT